MNPQTEKDNHGQISDADRCKVVQIGAALARGERGRTLKLKRELPKGITLGERHDGRPLPFFVRSGRLRKVHSYASEKDRNDKAAELWSEQIEHGKRITDEFDGALWRKLIDTLKRTGTTLDELEKCWERTRQNGNSNLTLRDAIARYVELRKGEGVMEKTDTWRHMRKHLVERLTDALGDARLCAIEANDLRKWADSLRVDGEQVSAMTRRHHLTSAKTFFKRAAAEGWIERDPSKVVALPPFEEWSRKIIPVREAFEFFKANRNHRSVARIALEAFGGLRYSSAGRLQAEHLHFDRRGIFLPGKKHKGKKNKFRQGQPANLWTWLEHAPKECWGLSLRSYADEKTEMLVAAKLRPMILKTEADRERARELRNTWRHSFISYLLAKTSNTPAVGRLAQHSRQGTTEGYEGLAYATDAELYFAITPETVLMTWEEFSANFAPPNENVPQLPA